MKKLQLIAFMFGMVSIAAAQTSNTGAGTAECKLKLAEAPAIRGIRLGMTIDQLLAVFPDSEKNESIRDQLSRSMFGRATASINPSSSSTFLGVKYLTLTFFDGELYSFNLHYDGPVWNTGRQFATKVAEALKLPGIEFWRDLGSSDVYLMCDGFEVTTRMTGGPGSSSISVRNREKDASKAYREREEAVKDKARNAFKP
jgi:hypothetical protein